MGRYMQDNAILTNIYDSSPDSVVVIDKNLRVMTSLEGDFGVF